MKKIFITFATLITLLAVWSCKESFLTVIPQNGNLTDVGFFKTTEDFDAFLFGAYAELQGVADMISIPSSLMQDVISENSVAVLPVYMSPANDAFYNKFWQPMYNISNRSNTILEKVAAAPETDRARIEGEAKFFRGFAYFNLARAFGSVPLILDSYKFEQDKTGCTEEEKIWDQVIMDLKDASGLMPTRAQWGEVNLGRATKGTALAFLANAYMYKKDWANAATASQDLIALGEYDLMPEVRGAFSRNTENSKEAIFEIQFRDDNNFNWGGNYNKGSLLPKLTAPASAGPQHAPGGGWGSFAFSRKYADSFDPADERRKELVKIAGETYQGEDMATPFVLPGDPAEATNAFSTKYWRGAKVGPNDLLNPQNTPFFRYSEFLLNYAEILFEQGRATEAYAELNKVRNRAKLPSLEVSSDRETFMRALMDERRWELGMEPNIWFHYTRTGRAAEFLAREYNITFNPIWFKFPIPQKDRNVNPNLCQNEGY
jgi:hypothetical protein